MYYVYIMANWNNKVIYTGVTNDLCRRVFEHKNKLLKGFTEKYNINKLVYYDMSTDIEYTIAREKEIKGWIRGKKNELVSSFNNDWRDLSNEIY